MPRFTASKAAENSAPAPTQGAFLRDLMATREAVKAFYRPMLALHGLTEQQWRVLAALWTDGMLDATRLAERAAHRPSSLTRMLTILEGRGLVAARRDPADARRTQLRLTRSGNRLMARVEPDVRAIETRIEGAIGAGQLHALEAGLERARIALNDVAPPTRLRTVS